MKKLKSIIIALFIAFIAFSLVFAVSESAASSDGMPLLLIAATMAFGINWLAFIPAAIFKTEKYYDVMGSVTYLATTLTICYLSSPLDERAYIVAGMVIIWAARLGSFLFARISNDGHDRRFNEIKINPARFFVAWTLQGAWVTFTALAAYTIITSSTRIELDIFFYIGALMWVIGIMIEVIADSQKSAFKKDPANEGKFIQTGLWSWSRHPNYFGEILLWLGVFVIAIPLLSGMQWLIIISPIFVYLLLTKVSGIPLLAKSGMKRWGDDPDYQAYLKRTSRLLPRPSK